MCKNCITYLRMSFLGLFHNIKHNGKEQIQTQSMILKSITLGDTDECKLLLSKLYLGICSTYCLHHLAGSKLNILRDKSFCNNINDNNNNNNKYNSYDYNNYGDDDSNYTWVIDKLTVDEFIAHSVSTGEKVNVVLKCGIPVHVQYTYYSDLVRFGLDNLSLHGEYVIQQGNTHLKGNYNYGLRTGMCKYTSNLHTNTCYYVNDYKHGPSTTHYQGQRIEEQWVNGKLQGCKSVYQGDTLIHESIYHNDKLVSTKKYCR